MIIQIGKHFVNQNRDFGQANGAGLFPAGNRVAVF